MYLTKFKIDTSKSNIRKALADRQVMHSTIQKMFGTDRKTSNVLYRLNGNNIYVTADKRPNLIDGFDFMGSREIEAVEGVHNFSIVTIPRKGKDNKKYILRTEEERLLWMHDQAEKKGFKILSIREMGREPINSRKKGFDVVAYRYDGLLRVTDSEKFENSRRVGIGTMKAYGCGMLVVA